jgi:hypothetical protein
MCWLSVLMTSLLRRLPACWLMSDDGLPEERRERKERGGGPRAQGAKNDYKEVKKR